MVIKANVLAETSQTKDNVEYVQITCMEDDANPLLQMFDYSLAPAEKTQKGTLVGKKVKLQVSNIRAIFAGRPQFAGRMEVAK
jgi:hypothetical protein